MPRGDSKGYREGESVPAQYIHGEDPEQFYKGIQESVRVLDPLPLGHRVSMS